MAAFNFPNSPSTNDTHTENSVTWKWDGTVWKRQGVAGAQGAQGHQGVQGAAGAQGAQGHQGVQGAAGSATISNNADNRVITGGSGTNLNGEANLTFDGTDLTQTIGASNKGIKLTAAGSHYPSITFDANRSAENNGIMWLDGKWNGTSVGAISIEAGDDTTNKDDGKITFYTTQGGSMTRKMAIEQDGNVYIDNGLLAVSGSTSETSTFTGNGVQISHASGSTIFIGTQVGADGKISLTNNSNLHFWTNNTERVRITSDGKFLVGTTTSNGFKFKVSDGGGYEFALNPNDSGINSFVNYNRSGSAYVDCKIVQRELQLWSGTSPAERLRIASNGKVFIGADATDFSDAGTFLNIRNNTYGGRLGFSNNTATAGVALMEQFAYWGTNKIAGIIATAGTDTTNKDDGYLRFYTRPSGGAVTERLRITSAGEITKPDGTTVISQNYVGVGTMTTTIRNAGVGTEKGAMTLNVTTGALEAYGGTTWVTVKSNLTPLGTINNPAYSGYQLKQLGTYSSGNYYIKPAGYSGSAIECYVDMTTAGGGWTLIAAFAKSHSGYAMSQNTSGLNESALKGYATTIPSNNASANLNKNFVNYLWHQNSSSSSNSDYSVLGVHGSSSVSGTILFIFKANSSYRNNSNDVYRHIYDTGESNNKYDFRYYTSATNTVNHYVGINESSFNSFANYSGGRSCGGSHPNTSGCYHYWIDDQTGGGEWSFRENNDDTPAGAYSNSSNVPSNFFVR